MAHPDLNELLNTLLPFAKQTLGEHGEFYPFGAWMCNDGRVVDVGAKDPETDYPRSQRLIELLTEAFRQRAHAGEIRAAGACFDVLIQPPKEQQKSDAIQLALEHRDGEAADVFLPYRRDEAGILHYGELFACKRASQFFAPASGL